MLIRKTSLASFLLHLAACERDAQDFSLPSSPPQTGALVQYGNAHSLTDRGPVCTGKGIKEQMNKLWAIHMLGSQEVIKTVF